ncbi:Flap-structured DNA-binding and RNA-binding protein, partial [Coemansia nantahalensis]
MMSANKPPTATTAAADAAATPAGGSAEQQAPPGLIPPPPRAPFAEGRSGRPASETFFSSAQHPLPEAKHVDRWFESLTHFEDVLEDMAKASLDTDFKSELDTVD